MNVHTYRTWPTLWARAHHPIARLSPHGRSMESKRPAKCPNADLLMLSFGVT